MARAAVLNDGSSGGGFGGRGFGAIGFINGKTYRYNLFGRIMPFDAGFGTGQSGNTPSPPASSLEVQEAQEALRRLPMAATCS